MLIVIRADASQYIGTGHVMRCLTLAEGLCEAGASVEFIVRSQLDSLNEIIKSKGFCLHELYQVETVDKDLAFIQQRENDGRWLHVTQEQDAKETIILLEDRCPEWLVVDHYGLDELWESRVCNHVQKLMVIDDLADRQHDCDVLLDQNYFPEKPSRYDDLVAPSCTKIFGPEFALLRSEFTKHEEGFTRRTGVVKSILVFFGGTDLCNTTSQVLEVLAAPEFGHLEISVVLGASNIYRSEIQQKISQLFNATLYVQVENMGELMLQADLAIGAGGVTTWERMAIGLPSIVITIAENQTTSAKNLGRDGFIRWLGRSSQLNAGMIYKALLEALNHPGELLAQSRKCKQLVNGKGAQRLVSLMGAGPDANSLYVRKAENTDSRLYWYWANDPVVRENAFNQRAISWGEHFAWFNERLADTDSMLLVIESEFGPVGQVRFDRSGIQCIISYSLAKQFRGMGLARATLSKAIDHICKKQIFTLIAEVKETNFASLKVFKQLGFCEVSPVVNRGVCRFQLESIPSKT